MRIQMYLVAAVASLSFAACDGDKEAPQDPDGPVAGVDAPPADGPVTPPPITMSFFITSTGNVNAAGAPMGADFRRPGMNDTDGLAGADEFCRKLAAAAVPALGTKTWRAYLSTTTVNAKDRIGTGPWYNQKLVKIADNVTDLLDPTTGAAGKNKIDGTTGLDEKGVAVPLGVHDIITGTLANGTASANTCANWTDNTPPPNNVAKATTGHYNRDGGGADKTSWSSAHDTNGCTLERFNSSGGRGSIYCFATN